MVWPGLGLVLGAGIGSVVGLLIAAEVFFVYGGAGAGIGLIAGAAVEALSRRSAKARRDPKA